MMRTEDFFYEFPPELTAKKPLSAREQSRMMILDRADKKFFHQHFFNFPDYFKAGDLMILNNTKVLPARVFAQKSTGGKVEVLLVRSIDKNNNVWECLVKPATGIRNETTIYFQVENSKVPAVFKKVEEKIKLLQFSTEISVEDLMRKIGSSPLPPYMQRKEADSEDLERYQTVFAEKEGAIAAPTAGLHFTPQIFDRLREKGVEIHSVTLHVGLGTFEPVRAENIFDHVMHTEFYEVPKTVVEAVQRAKKENRSVTAIGTTSVRALESWFGSQIVQGDSCPPAARHGLRRNDSGMSSTNLFIYPGYSFKVVDRLLTNFHQPESTLIMLTSAFAGKEFLFESYREAIQEKYRLFSYGDCMLIL